MTTEQFEKLKSEGGVKTIVVRNPGKSLEELLDPIPVPYLCWPDRVPMAEFVEYFQRRVAGARHVA
jgi:hypothetical protein